MPAMVGYLNHWATAAPRLCTKYIETFVIPLDELQKPFQGKLRVLHTEEAFNGLFDFSVASKATSFEILLQNGNRGKSLSGRSGLNGELIGAPNQELQYGLHSRRRVRSRIIIQ
ncbi:hypothetical protein TNCV_1329511 [Trichonephila clavipes]|nr:hypothetical protein TNCV_1329511 [Trichonephila clavipes]